MLDSESSEGREEGRGYASSSHGESSNDMDLAPRPPPKRNLTKKKKHREKVTKVDGPPSKQATSSGSKVQKKSKQATPSGSKVQKKSSKPGVSKQKWAKHRSKTSVPSSSRGDARDSASNSGEDAPIVDDGNETNEDKALSLLTSSVTEAEAERMRDSFAIPENIEIIIPGPQEYIWSPPPGSLSMCVESLYGFRVPIPSFIEKFFWKLKICPTQIDPGMSVVSYSKFCFV